MNFLGAQAHFQQFSKIFSSSYESVKQTCCISKYVCFSKTNVFSMGDTQGDSYLNGKTFTSATRINYESHASIQLKLSEIPQGTHLRNLRSFFHQHPRLVYAQMALETRCCTTEQLLLSHVTNPLPSWQ